MELLVLEGQAETERFWACTFESPAVREEFAWPGLFRAQALVVPFGHARTYLERYSEPDKASTGLGVSEEAWPVPYWLTDAAMAAMSMLLAAVDEDLGALFFGIFEGEDVVRAEFGVPDGYQAVGALALGHPAPDRSSGSLRRGRRPAAEIVHRGHW